MTAIARIAGDGETVIPPEVRAVLAIAPGDAIEWEISAGGRVEVRRARQLDFAYLKSLEQTSSEWNSPEDEEAYSDL